VDAFYKDKVLETKISFADIVTETDKGVEHILTEALKKKYPTHA